MDERFALPRWESHRHLTDEDQAQIDAINARLKPLVDSPTVRPVVVTYWADDLDRPIERFVIASQMLPSATGLIPAPGAWGHRATHITIDAPWSPTDD